MTRPTGQLLASVLFLLSGLTGLGLEVLWFKRFGHLWGSSSLAMAAVVAAFLLGLGLGAWIFGHVADRLTRPLAAYGGCQIAIGLLALAVPFELRWLLDHAATLQSSVLGRPVLQAFLRFTLTFAVLGPPCVAMGATLPLLIRHFTLGGRRLGAAASWLYGFNTLGAAIGAWLIGFHLLAELGLTYTNSVLAGVDLGVGALALAASRTLPPPSPAPAPAPLRLESPKELSSAAIHLAAALTGAGSLVLQMLWARELGLLLGASTYAFTAVIFVFVLGIGLGSLVFRATASRRESLAGTISLAVLLVVVPALVGRALEPQLALLIGSLKALRGSDLGNALVCSGASVVLEGLPTFGMGLLFPALVQATRRESDRSGRAVGGVYAWSTFGSILGATLATPWLLPELGGEVLFRAALGLFVLALLLLYPPARLPLRRAPLTAGLLGVLALLPLWGSRDPMDTNLGLYMYGSEQREIVGRWWTPLSFLEGSTSNILVLEQSLEAPPDPLAHPGGSGLTPRNLRVNGKIDASNTADMPMQLGLAYLPRFLRPEARSVLVIGLGSGATSGASLAFGGTRVTCCEIEPAMVEASRWFEPGNHRPLESQDFELVLDDGRSWLQSTERAFDLILSEPSNPWIAGVSNLFTLEFYQLVRKHLTREGLFVQWLQTYAFSPADYALVAGTLQRVFPRVALVRISRYDTLLIAGTGPVLGPAETLERAQALVDAHPLVVDDLERWFRTRDVRTILVGTLQLDEQGLARFVAEHSGGRLHTDQDMSLEFEAPRRLFSRAVSSQATMQSLIEADSAGFHRRLFLQWNCGEEQLDALRVLVDLYLARNLSRRAWEVVDLALAYAEDDAELLADHLLYGPLDDPRRFEEEVRHLLELSPRETYRLGSSLTRLGRFPAAVTVLTMLSERFPQSATTWAALGTALAAVGQEEQARAAIARAVSLDPVNDLVAELQEVVEGPR